MSSARVRFSQERPGITYVPSQSTQSTLLADIFSKQMPPRYAENRFNMDACTAASIGDEEVVKQLFKINPNVLTAKNKAGWTPLLYAAYLGHNNMIAYLLNNGAKVDDVNNKGQTPLMLASACGNLNVVRVLLDRGANVKLADVENRQSLHYAASCSQHVVVDALLLAGANPNAPDINGMTAVHEAAMSGHELTFLSLLEKGGDVKLKNLKNENCAALAADNKIILQIISNHKKESQDPLNEENRGNSEQPRTLTELLEEMDLARYSEQFKNENIDLNVFFELKRTDLDDMKIPFGPKKRMLDVIERYRTTGVIKTDACDKEHSSAASSEPLVGDDSNKYLKTLRGVRDINLNTKKYAMDALEALGEGQTERYW